MTNDEKRNEINAKAEEFMQLIYDHAPHGRRRSIAFTKLEEAAMWAIKAIYEPTSVTSDE